MTCLNGILDIFQTPQLYHGIRRLQRFRSAMVYIFSMWNLTCIMCLKTLFKIFSESCIIAFRIVIAGQDIYIKEVLHSEMPFPSFVLHLVSNEAWRRGWDSNPRALLFTRQIDFESTPLRPLRYLSIRTASDFSSP